MYRGLLRRIDIPTTRHRTAERQVDQSKSGCHMI